MLHRAVGADAPGGALDRRLDGVVAHFVFAQLGDCARDKPACWVSASRSSSPLADRLTLRALVQALRASPGAVAVAVADLPAR